MRYLLPLLFLCACTEATELPVAQTAKSQGAGLVIEGLTVTPNAADFQAPIQISASVRDDASNRPGDVFYRLLTTIEPVRWYREGGYCGIGFNDTTAVCSHAIVDWCSRVIPLSAGGGYEFSTEGSAGVFCHGAGGGLISPVPGEYEIAVYLQVLKRKGPRSQVLESASARVPFNLLN